MTIKPIIISSILLFGAANCARASEISCSPAPCVTSTVQITPTSTTNDAVEFSVGSTPNTNGVPAYTGVSVGSDYYVSGAHCATGGHGGFASWVTPDPGVTSFSGGCINPSGTMYFLSDPIAAAYAKPISPAPSEQLFVGSIGADTTEETGHEGNGEVFLRQSTNGGSTWGSWFGTAEPVNFDSGDPNYTYSFDNDGLWIDGSNGINQDCGYVSIMNENSDDAKEEIEVASGCPAETSGNWVTKSVWKVPSTQYITDFARVTSDLDAANYVYATWTSCPSKDATTLVCASNTAGKAVHIYFSRSSDNGSTWSTATNIFDVNLSAFHTNAFLPTPWGALPNTFERIAPIPQLVVTNGSNGASDSLLIVYETWNGTAMEVDYRTSTDSGTTWSSQHTISSQTNDQFFPCAVAGNGNFAVGGNAYAAWLDRRNDTNNKKYDVYAAHWNGTSWSNVTRITSTSSDPSKNHYGGGSFLGDYIGCNMWIDNSNTHSYFLIAWPDTSLTTGMVGMLAGYLGN